MTDKKYEVTSWAIVTTITRPDGTWFDRTITDFPEHIGIEINDWLTDYIKEENIIDKTITSFEVEQPEIVIKLAEGNEDYELI